MYKGDDITSYNQRYWWWHGQKKFNVSVEIIANVNWQYKCCDHIYV